MKARMADIELYGKEIHQEASPGALYNSLYQESRRNGAVHCAAKSIASRRWNLANRAYWEMHRK